jgi:hypothetical protein
MPLPSRTWKANVNGKDLELMIGQTGPDGVVGIDLLGFGSRGFWDETTQRLVFTVTAQPLASPFVGFFEAYLIRTPANPAPGEDVALTLAGIFSVPFATAGDVSHPAVPTSRRSTFGWYATATEVNQ